MRTKLRDNAVYYDAISLYSTKRDEFQNKIFESIKSEFEMCIRDREWRDRDNWNKYYRIYEGKWHNHTTGTHIHVDLSRRSLRIKFHGEKWYEVVERSRGLFVDRRGNEFYFRGDGIEYRSNGGDLMMRFYHDDRCGHRDDCLLYTSRCV